MISMLYPILTIADLTVKSGVTWLNDWAPLSALAVMTAIVLHIPLFMLARAFSIKEFENYAASEMLQAAATAVMIGFLIVMVNSALNLAHDIVHGQVTCNGETMMIGSDPSGQSTMDEAYDAIKCRIMEKANKVAHVQSSISTGWTTWNEFNQMNLQMSALGITFLKGDWLSELYRTTETKRITNNLATVLLIGLNAQIAIVNYLKANALTMFIPFGLLLRSFYFTRGAGALFIAFGIGMYFIFPIFYVLLDPNFVSIPPLAQEPSPPNAQPYCYATMSNTVTVLQTLQAGGLGTTSQLKQEEVREELSKSYIQLMLHPLVAFFLTMVFIRYMMTVLGSDSFELMRMISKVV